MSLLQKGTEAEWSILRRKKIVKEVVFFVAMGGHVAILIFGYNRQNKVCELWCMTGN